MFLSRLSCVLCCQRAIALVKPQHQVSKATGECAGELQTTPSHILAANEPCIGRPSVLSASSCRRNRLPGRMFLAAS